MIQKKEYAELYQELEVMEHNGIHISLDEVPASAFQVVQAHMVRETGTYMRDYVIDEEGHIERLIFNNIG